MPRSATRFSCRVRSPGTLTSTFYNSRLAYIPVFFFCFQSKKPERPHKSDSLVWYCCKGHNPQYVPFLITESPSHPNWNNWVKFERKFELHKKSNQSKQLTQEPGHIFTQASKEKVIFILPFFLQTEQFFSCFFLVLHRKDSPRWDKGQTLPGHILNHHIFNKKI